ncbi:TolC family protein [Bacteroidaceae bacterium HV4-6-C5C]|nr:TolC family protein [Bacteroidaceae bacterium HV4-6-C5C]
MDKKNLITLTCTLAASVVISAQEINYISIDEAVNTAGKNNANVQISELEHKISNANFHETDAVFLPQVSVGYTAVTTNNPLNAFGFLLNQRTVTSQDFDPAKLNDPSAAHNYSADIKVKLPLVNVDMFYARKGAKYQEEVYKNKAKYTQNWIAFEVRKAYTQLQFSYQAQQILQSTLEDVKRIYESVSNFYDQGLIQKSDVLNAQVQVNTVESALAKAGSSVKNASDELGLLMATNDGNDIYQTDSLSQQQLQLNGQAFSTLRPDVVAMQKAVDASRMMVKSSNMSFLPRINAFGSYNLNDSKAFGFDADSYLVGINLSWDIFSGNRNCSKLKASVLQRNKMQEELNLYVNKSRLEYNKTLRELQDLEVEIHKQKASVEQATEALRILSDRYKEGLTRTTDLLAAQAQLSQQRLQLAQAVMSYNITTYYLNLLSTAN